VARVVFIALTAVAIAVAVVATVILAVALPSYTQPAVRPEASLSLGVARLNVTAVVVGPGNFADGIVKELSDRVSKVVVYSDLSPEILQYAGKYTVLVLSSDWLKENAGREEVKEMIKLFADSGSMIYVNGTKAGVFHRMLYEMWYEKGLKSGAPPEALQELRERIESIPEDSRTGLGYMKVSEKHEVFVSGTLEYALKTFAEYREVENL